MFVVRVEDFEAVSFRAFRRHSDAISFATASAEQDDVADAEIYEIADVADPEKAVIAARYGYGMLVATPARTHDEACPMHVDFCGGIALGTGAGF